MRTYENFQLPIGNDPCRHPRTVTKRETRPRPSPNTDASASPTWDSLKLMGSGHPDPPPWHHRYEHFPVGISGVNRPVVCNPTTTTRTTGNPHSQGERSNPPKPKWAQRDSNPRHLPCKGSALAVSGGYHRQIPVDLGFHPSSAN